jgi:hypothetical protein
MGCMGAIRFVAAGVTGPSRFTMTPQRFDAQESGPTDPSKTRIVGQWRCVGLLIQFYLPTARTASTRTRD